MASEWHEIVQRPLKANDLRLVTQPKRTVVALEGDGSILMQLGTLGTIAMLAPKNLLVIVMHNAAYQITGNQKTATAFKTDITAMAQGAGLAQSFWAADEPEFEALIARVGRARAVVDSRAHRRRARCRRHRPRSRADPRPLHARPRREIRGQR